MKFGREERNGQRAGRGQQEIPSSFSWPSVLHPKLENDNTPPPLLFLSHATPPTLMSLFLRSFFSCMAVSMCAQHAHHRQRRALGSKSSGRWRVHSSTLFAVDERCQHMPAMQMCSYLMSSSKSHSDWCLKCSLVICSVCVFFSSCVTLTWREQKVKDWCFIHAKQVQVALWENILSSGNIFMKCQRLTLRKPWQVMFSYVFLCFHMSCFNKQRDQIHVC